MQKALGKQNHTADLVAGAHANPSFFQILLPCLFAMFVCHAWLLAGYGPNCNEVLETLASSARENTGSGLLAQGTPEGVEDNGLLTRVAAFPIGIDPGRFKEALEMPDVKAHIAQLRQRYAGRKARLGPASCLPGDVSFCMFGDCACHHRAPF